MKKILALFLSLMLLLPAVGLCEAAEAADTYTVEFDDFYLNLTSYDLIQKADEKTDGGLLFIVWPNYDENATFTTNMNGLWISQDLGPELPGLDAESYGQSVVAQAAQQMTAQGMTTTNEQLLSAEVDAEDGVLSLVYSMDVDYTPAGVDLQTTIYQLQTYVALGEKGTYVFTITSYSLDDLNALIPTCLDAIEFKE